MTIEMVRLMPDNTLNEKQYKFSAMLSLLIQKAYDLGYAVTMGDVWALDRHRKNSYHYKRLAADINLFKDGIYLTETEDHLLLGQWWESIGGTWGGRFADGNHYSLGENNGNN